MGKRFRIRSLPSISVDYILENFLGEFPIQRITNEVYNKDGLGSVVVVEFCEEVNLDEVRQEVRKYITHEYGSCLELDDDEPVCTQQT